jgi:hypothetical protein
MELPGGHGNAQRNCFSTFYTSVFPMPIYCTSRVVENDTQEILRNPSECYAPVGVSMTLPPPPYRASVDIS